MVDSGDRLPATLEGWQARFPELGPMRFWAWQDVLTGRAPTDVLTPRERSEFGLGLVRFFIYRYEPARPEDPDGEVTGDLGRRGALPRREGRQGLVDAGVRRRHGSPPFASEDDDGGRARGRGAGSAARPRCADTRSPTAPPRR